MIEKGDRRVQRVFATYEADKNVYGMIEALKAPEMEGEEAKEDGEIDEEEDEEDIEEDDGDGDGEEDGDGGDDEEEDEVY